MMADTGKKKSSGSKRKSDEVACGKEELDEQYSMIGDDNYMYTLDDKLFSHVVIKDGNVLGDKEKRHYEKRQGGGICRLPLYKLSNTEKKYYNKQRAN